MDAAGKETWSGDTSTEWEATETSTSVGTVETGTWGDGGGHTGETVTEEWGSTESTDDWGTKAEAWESSTDEGAADGEGVVTNEGARADSDGTVVEFGHDLVEFWGVVWDSADTVVDVLVADWDFLNVDDGVFHLDWGDFGGDAWEGGEHALEAVEAAGGSQSWVDDGGVATNEAETSGIWASSDEGGTEGTNAETTDEWGGDDWSGSEWGTPSLVASGEWDGLDTSETGQTTLTEGSGLEVAEVSALEGTNLLGVLGTNDLGSLALGTVLGTDDLSGVLGAEDLLLSDGLETTELSGLETAEAEATETTESRSVETTGKWGTESTEDWGGTEATDSGGTETTVTAENWSTTDTGTVKHLVGVWEEREG